ncbi:MAG: 2'-5' RNA ligase family protein [Candidatus Shapirobacteria bacterium]|jgi:2'-5' RNA ligase
MNKENLYFIEVELPKKENEYLRCVTKRVNKIFKIGEEVGYDFHLTVEPSLYCSREAIRVDLNEWLSMQNPFEFTLDKIDCFKNRTTGLIYLTTTDLDEKEAIVDLHYGIHEIIKSTNLRKQNNHDYIPHVTLLKEVPLNRLDEVQKIFEGEIKLMRINISEILVRKKYNNGEWMDMRRFNLGENPTFSYQFY